MNKPYENKPGEFAVFANDSNNPQAPSMRSVAFEIPAGIKPGDKVQIAFWRKTSQGGKEYYSAKMELSTKP